MDLDISRWILEFVARKINDENLVHRLFSVLRVPCDDVHLRKTILVKRIESEVLEASVSRKMLDSLESIAEIDKSQGFLITESMKSAYCAVAVDCTVRFIEEGGNAEGSKYFEMMERIWWERVGRLKELDLDSQELSKWRAELERAISDDELSGCLSNRNTRNVALRKVRVYVNEAWKAIGPTFLELAATEQFRERRNVEENRDNIPLLDDRKQVAGTGSAPISVEEKTDHVNELAPSREKAKESSCVASSTAKLPTAQSIDAQRIVKNGSTDGDELAAHRKKVTDSGHGPVDENIVHVNIVSASGEQAERSTDAARLLVKLPPAKLDDAPRTHKMNGCNDVNALVAPREQLRHSSHQTIEGKGDHINEVAASRVQGNGSSSNTHRGAEGSGGELPASEKQAKGSSGGPQMTVGMNVTLGNELGASDRCVTRNERRVQETQGKHKHIAETPPENITRKRKHVGGPLVRHGRAKINVNEQDLELSSSKLNSLHTPAVNEVREELRSSMQELHAAVKDPLPGAEQIAERVLCELASRRSIPVRIFEKQTTVHSRSSAVDKGNRDVQANAATSAAVQANGASCESVLVNGASTEAVHGNGTTAEASQADRVRREPDQGNEPNAESLGATEVCAEFPVAYQNNADVRDGEGDEENEQARHQNGGPKPSLFERNHTARTFEWDDSIADTADQQPSSSRRIRLPSPEGTDIEPLQRDELTKFSRRRRRRKWSVEEEETLREGVRKFGRGNWKVILNAHRDAFEDRTEVDLKDKWRNMIK